MNTTWQIAAILPRFYEKNAKSLGGIVGQFKIISYEFGHDSELVDASTSPPTLRPYDAARNDTPGKFYAGDFGSGDVIYNEDGRLLFKCSMPENAISEPVQYSLTVLRDMDGDAVAVSVDLPDWVVPAEGVETHPYLNFPVS